MSRRHRVMKAVLKRGAWTHEEDMKLVTYINRYGIWNWPHIPKHAGLSRTGKSCRLRWVNYLNPNVKRGNFTEEEDDFVIKMIQTMGTRWSAIAASLPGRTDNELKNRWHTHLKKRSESNNKLVQCMESQKDTISTSDYSSQEESVEASKHSILLSAPEASKPEECEFPISMSPDISNIDGASSSLTPTLGGNIIVQDTLETIGDPDPHIRFWREPYSLDHMYMENHHASAYVNHGFELPSPESTLGSHNYDYRFDILSVENQFDGMNDSNVYI